MQYLKKIGVCTCSLSLSVRQVLQQFPEESAISLFRMQLRIAGVDEHASVSAIRSAYDDVQHQDLTVSEQIKAKEAVEVLTDNAKRAEYDSLGYSGTYK
jgi:hypothetical protein